MREERVSRYSERYYTHLSPVEDAHVIQYIHTTPGNGRAEKLRNAIRTMWEVYQQAQQGRQAAGDEEDQHTEGESHHTPRH